MICPPAELIWAESPCSRLVPIAGPTGIQTILNVGASVGRGFATGHGNIDQPIDPAHDHYADGKPVPTGWLVTPHAGSSLSAAQVTQIINQGIAEAQLVRAQIRLPLGTRTEMVLAVADKDGSILGLYRMPDATVFLHRRGGRQGSQHRLL